MILKGIPFSPEDHVLFPLGHAFDGIYIIFYYFFLLFSFFLFWESVFVFNTTSTGISYTVVIIIS